MGIRHYGRFISQLETWMQKYGDLKNGQEHYFWALSLLFMSGWKMETIKTRSEGQDLLHGFKDYVKVYLS